MHQINLENIDQTTRKIQKAKTSITEILDDTKITSLNRKALCKSFEATNKVYNGLGNLANFLKMNQSIQTKEFDQFKVDISIMCIKSKSSQISYMVDEHLNDDNK